MLTKKNRFHGLGSLRHVYERGQTVRSPQLALRFMSNPRRHSWRCAVVVSKKVSKSAVERNRIRRRVYEVIRHQASNLTSPVDLIFTVFSSQVSEMPHVELEKIIQNLFSQAELTDTSVHAIIEPKES